MARQEFRPTFALFAFLVVQSPAGFSVLFQPLAFSLQP
jgi:hypothetical protein